MHVLTVIAMSTAAIWLAAPAAQAAPLPADAGTPAIVLDGGLAVVGPTDTGAELSGTPAPERTTPVPVGGQRSTSPWGAVALVLVAAFAITLATVGSIRLTRLTKPPQSWRPSTG